MEAAKTNRFYCGHCEQEVSRRTLYTHKRLYYNRMSKEWSKQKISYAENAGIDRQTPDVRQGEMNDLKLIQMMWVILKVLMTLDHLYITVLKQV